MVAGLAGRAGRLGLGGGEVKWEGGRREEGRGGPGDIPSSRKGDDGLSVLEVSVPRIPRAGIMQDGPVRAVDHNVVVGLRMDRWDGCACR